MDRTSQSQTGVDTYSSDERSFNVWLPWALLLIVSLVGWMVLDYQKTKTALSVQKTKQVAKELNASVNAMSSAAKLAAVGQGPASSVESLKESVQANLFLLERGGFSENIPVIPLSNNISINMQPINEALKLFDQSTKPLANSSETLSKSFSAQLELSSKIDDMLKTSSDIGQSQALTTNAWGAALNPVRKSLSSKEISTVPAVFSPFDGGQLLAQQWNNFFATRAKELSSMSSIAQNDKSLSSEEKSLVAKLARQVADISNNTTVLLNSFEDRIKAQRIIGEINETSSRLNVASSDLVNQINSIQEYPVTLKNLTLGAMVLTWIGLVLVLRALWIMGYDRWRANQFSIKGGQLNAVLDRITNELRNILLRQSNNKELRVEASSPVFALTSIINQVLKQRDESLQTIEEQGSLLNKTYFEINEELRHIINTNQETKESGSELTDNIFKLLDTYSASQKKLASLNKLSESLLELSSHGSSNAQSTLWGMGNFRENTQAIAKRIKRLGESAQNIATSADVIKESSRKIKVVALNIAVEAANYGEQGRAFTSLARELERLALNADQSIKDIDNQVYAIQSDSKETVFSMEEGTSSVVESTDSTNKSLMILKKIEATTQSLISDLNQLSEQVNNINTSLNDISAKTDNVSNKVLIQEQHLANATQKSESVRSVIQSFRKWLVSFGRDI